VAKASKGTMAIGSLTVAVGGSFNVKKTFSKYKNLKTPAFIGNMQNDCREGDRWTDREGTAFSRNGQATTPMALTTEN
jgi:hypothetical protein